MGDEGPVWGGGHRNAGCLKGQAAGLTIAVQTPRTGPQSCQIWQIIIKDAQLILISG